MRSALLAVLALASGCSLLSLDVLEGGAGGAGATSSGAEGGSGTVSGASVVGSTGPSSGGGDPGSGGAPSGTGGGSSTGGGGADVECGGPSALADDFSDEPRTWLYWSDDEDDDEIAISGGELTLSPPTDGSNPWISFYSKYRVDVRGDGVSARVLEVLSPELTTASSSMLILDGQSNDYIALRAADGDIQVVTWISEVFTTIAVQPYDPLEMLHWRLRHEATGIYAETSPDGARWGQIGAVDESLLFDMSQVQVAFLARLEESAADPGVMRVDDLVGMVEDGRYCEPATFQDDFTDPDRSPEWDRAVLHDECGPVEEGGALRFPFVPADSEYCSYRTSHLFDLRGDGVVVRLVEQPSVGETAEVYLEVSDPGGAGALLIANGDSITARADGATTEQLRYESYDAADEPWWRIRDDEGVIRYEVSADGRAWRQLAETPVFFDSSAVGIGIVGGTWDDPLDPGAAAFDDYNLPP